MGTSRPSPPARRPRPHARDRGTKRSVGACKWVRRPGSPGDSHRAPPDQVESHQNPPGSASWGGEGLAVTGLSPASRGSAGHCKTSRLDSWFPSLCAPELRRWLIIQRRLALLLGGCLGPDVLGVAGLWLLPSPPSSALPDPRRGRRGAAGGAARGLGGALSERLGLRSAWRRPGLAGTCSLSPWPVAPGPAARGGAAPSADPGARKEFGCVGFIRFNRLSLV